MLSNVARSFATTKRSSFLVVSLSLYSDNGASTVEHFPAGLSVMASLHQLVHKFSPSLAPLPPALQDWSSHQSGQGAWHRTTEVVHHPNWTKEVVHLCNQTLDGHGLYEDADTFASLLRVCGNSKAMYCGLRIHAHLIESGLERTTTIDNLLVQMYAKCGALEEAMEEFDNVRHRNVVLWNVMITAFTQQRQGQEASQLFEQMQHEGAIPAKVTFICMLSACSSQEALVAGKVMHLRILEGGFEADVVVCTALVNMYGRCGSLEAAQDVFNIIQDRDVVSWNAMITLYAKHEHGEKSIILFNQMQLEGVIPNKITFISILDACATLAEGKWMHRYIMDIGFSSDVIMGTAIVNMYGKCGSLAEALYMFKNLLERDTVSWNAIITLYAQHGQCKQAFALFYQMLNEGFIPNKVTFVTMLDVCASQAVPAAGEQMHARILDGGFETDLVLENAIINMYGKCGRLNDAMKIFDNLTERNVVTWTGLIAAYAQHGQGKQALQTFHEMQWEGVTPNEVTFISTLDACASEAALTDGKQIHYCIMGHGLELATFIGTALVNMYGKCGSLIDARTLFDKLPKHDVLCWTTMIAVYMQHGQGREALHLFNQMQHEGVMPDKGILLNILSGCSDQIVLTEVEQMHASIQDYGFELDDIIGGALVSMYGKCGKLMHSRKVFDKLLKQDAVLWNIMIALYVQHGQGKEALQLYEQMCLAGVMPDKVTFVTILAACASEVALAEGEELHRCICETGLDSDEQVASALVSMYGKCGNLKVSRVVFDSVQKQDVILWNAMIGVYAQHGEGTDALRLFDQMQQEGVMPDVITLVSVLIACSHSGLIDEGCCYFTSMMLAFGIFPTVDHHVCMIDILRRAGRLDEAEDFVSTMPFQPMAVSFMMLLGACRFLADIERGDRAAKHVVELDGENAAPYIMLSNIYNAARRGYDADNACNGS